MKKIAWVALVIIATLVGVTTCGNQENDGDDDSENDDTGGASDDGGGDDIGPSDDDTCLSDDPIYVYDTIVLVNGEEVPILDFDLYENDIFTFSFEYADSDCNIRIGDAGGEITYMYPNNEIAELTQLPEDTPCSTEELGGPMAIDLDLSSFVGFGENKGVLAFQDVCGKGGGHMIKFTLYEGSRP
jgi:hypothetical protein